MAITVQLVTMETLRDGSVVVDFSDKTGYVFPSQHAMDRFAQSADDPTIGHRLCLGHLRGKSLDTVRGHVFNVGLTRG